MKKSLVRYTSLGIVSLMGVGGLISAFNFSKSGPIKTRTEGDSITYIERSWNGTSVESVEKTISEYTVLNYSTTTLSDGWYVVNKNITNYNDRFTITGTVNLILCDNVYFKCSKGFTTTDATLNIYGQKEDSGTLSITNAASYCAAIGGDANASGGTLNVYGGALDLKGGMYGAGIGTGQNDTANTLHTGAVTIYGGAVYAEGGSYSAGIGGGYQKNNEGTIIVDPVTIYGGVVTAKCPNNGNGIGAGLNSSDNGTLTVASDLNVLENSSGTPVGEQSEITTDYQNVRKRGMRICKPISYVKRSWDDTEQKVVETPATCLSYTPVATKRGTWFGDWYVVNSNVIFDNSSETNIYGTVNLILLDGYTLTNTKGIFISGGYDYYGLNIYGQSNDTGTLITGGGETSRAGIGGYSSENAGFLNIYGGTIKAKGGTNSPGIGSGFYRTTTTTMGNISIYGGNITAIGGSDSIPEYAASGIGGAAGKQGPNLTVYDGFVRAIGGKCGGAGIGGGYMSSYMNNSEVGGDGGTIDIKGGTVVASGASGAMGIGSGRVGTNNGSLSVSSDLEVYGGDIENSGTIVEEVDGDYSRSRYMVVKAPGEKVDPACSIPTFASGSSDQKLSELYLPDGWAWETPSATIGDGGDYKAIYTPANPDIFNTLEQIINVKANEPISYINKSWNESSKKVDKTIATCKSYRSVSEDMDTTWTEGWYYVNSDVSFANRINVEGTVNIILGDGYKLTANDGIGVAIGNTINIFSQSDGDNTGKLEATVTGSYLSYSPLGGPYHEHSGAINIYGGDITATGIATSSGSLYGSAAIGGSADANTGPITIYGGKVTATSGYSGPGIGGGALGNYSLPRHIDDIIIYDGTVVAKGGEGAPGIGLGRVSSYNTTYQLVGSVEMESIKIFGGDITATGGSSGAGIGTGTIGYANSSLYNTVEINEISISGGTVTATGGNGASGIGGGSVSGVCTISNILIRGGTVTATAKGYSSYYSSAGIGSGAGFNGSLRKLNLPNISISGGTVTATGAYGPGIGVPTCSADSVLGTISITGGFVTATAGDGFDAIGCSTSDTTLKGTLVLSNSMELLGDNTENPETVRTQDEYESERWQYIIVKSNHTHEFTYSLTDSNTIYAECTSSCYLTEEERTLTLTLNSEENYYAYDGTAKTITFASGYSDEAFENINVQYYQGDTLVSECVDVGEYTAKVSFGSATAEIDFEITKGVMNPTVNINDWDYGDSASTPSVSGNLGGGEVTYEYKVKGADDTTYTEVVPTNAGEYTIRATISETEDYFGTSATTDFVINKINSSVVTDPTASTDLYYNGESQVLISGAGSSEGGTLVYSLDGENYSSELPAGLGVDSYTVYYKVEGDANHNDSDPQTLVVVISENDKTSLTDKITEANEYLDSIGESYPLINDELQSAIDQANAIKDNKNVTVSEINQAIIDLNNAINKAKADVAAIENSINLINDIGSVTYDGGISDSSSAIEAARDAYDALDDDLKQYVSNYQTLVDDENLYKHVDVVATLIEAIPEASESDEYYSAVDTAKGAYNLLTSEEQAIIRAATNVNYEKVLNDNVAAKDVIEKIQDIGSLTYDGGQNDSLAAIEAAEEAYDAIKDNADVKAIVDSVNHQTLVDDRTIYDHVDNVANLIEAIPEASESDEYYNAVDTAKAAYDNLTKVEQILLGDAPNFDYVKKLNDNVAAKNVIKLIDDINEITYNGGKDDSLADIINAEKEYNKLTSDQKAIVNGVNKDTLDHDRLVYDHVDHVGDLIKEIPEASNTDDYYNAVDAAKAAYDLLTPEEQAILGDAIDFNYEKVLEDNIKAEEVIKIIDGIGEITYNGGFNDSLEDIENAEAAYGALSADQKALVELANLDTLEEDRETYDAVDETVKLIESIGNVSHGGESDSKEAIDAAKAAYDSLTTEEKELVGSYNNLDKVLEDDEAVYGAMEAIDSIGEVSYTTESEETIKHAQEVYDSLTEDQKEQLGNGYKNILIDAGNKYETVSKQGDLLFLILIIVTSLTLVGGIVFLYFLIKKKRNNNDDRGGDNSKGKPVKAYSFGGLVTSLILVSHYLDAKYITLYVLASLAIVIWIVCLIVALTIKRKKAIKEENKPQQVQQVKETEPQENVEDEEEVETITDEKGNIFQIRFIKSFTAKLIQSSEETKKYYEELKNEVLSYKKANSRVSWHYDAINSGREYVLKFAIRGKTLCVYLPLNPEELEEKYKVEKVESKKFEDVPCLYRIKNDRRCEYAKDLIAMVAANLGLEKGEERHEVYSNLLYEENKPLIARGLIKELKVKVNKPIESPMVLESKVNSDGDEVVVTKDSSGNLFEIRYIKSFTAKLSQSEVEVKDYYSVLKNYVLSYKGVHSRVSWHYDAINIGRDYILKFAIRGKTLCLYYDLETSKLDKKYKVEEAKGNRYSDVPCLYRIKNDRRCEYAKELIDLLMKEHGLNQGDVPNEDYRIKKESTKALLDKGLIKEVKSKIHDKKVIEHYQSITVSKADEVMSDEKAESSVEEVEVNKHKEGSKVIINIDTLSEHYNNGDEVTLDSLIDKGLVSSKVGHIKVLARGELNKKLHVVANEYSLQAIKMIVLVGGTVKKIK